MRSYIHPETGKIIQLRDDQALRVVEIGKHYGEFHMIYKRFMRHVALQAPEALPTLHALIWFNDVHNIVRASHERLALETNKSLPTIARHMKRFRELQVVLNDIEVPHACYRIHPLLAWKGSAKERDIYLAGIGTSHPFNKLIAQIAEDYKHKPDEELEPQL